jgi:TolB protein
VLLAAAAGALPGVTHAAFPGKNGKLALEGDTKLGIYTANPDGSHLTRLTDKKPFPFEPAYSADGKWIAFERSQKLWKMKADGSHEQKLAKYPGGGQITSCISWAPDGKRLAFDRDDDIWTVKSNGNDAKRIVNNPTIDSCPSYSPNGKRIVFATSDSGNKDLVIAHANGSQQAPLTTPQGGTPFGPSEPDWSPDGKRIAFNNGTDQGDIATIRTDGTHVRFVNATAKTEVDPAYSPNGKQMAYAVLINQSTTRIRTAPVDGGKAHNVTPKGEHWFNPSWQPR